MIGAEEASRLQRVASSRLVAVGRRDLTRIWQRRSPKRDPVPSAASKSARRTERSLACCSAEFLSEPDSVAVPLFPGKSLTTRVWDAAGGLGFESVNAQGVPVLKDGLLELR